MGYFYTRVSEMQSGGRRGAAPAPASKKAATMPLANYTHLPRVSENNSLLRLSPGSHSLLARLREETPNKQTPVRYRK